MPNNPGTFEVIIRELGEALKPLADILKPDIMERLGVRPPAAFMSAGQIPTKLTDSIGKAGELPPAITALQAAITAGNKDGMVKTGRDLGVIVIDLIQKLIDLGEAIKTQAGTLAGTQKTEIEAFAGEFAARLVEFCVVEYMHTRASSMLSVFSILGITENELVEELGAAKVAYDKKRIYLDRIPQFFNSPEQYLKDIYEFGKPTFTGTLFFDRIKALIESLNLPVDVYKIGSEPLTLEAYIFNLQVDATASPPFIKGAITLPVSKDFTQTIDINDIWKGSVAFQGSFVAGVGAKIKPPFNLELQPPSGTLNMNLLLGIKAEKLDGTPVLLIGSTEGTRLETKTFGVSVGVVTTVSGSGATAEPAAQLRVEQGKLVIDLGGGDGFIQSLLSGIRIEADFDILGNWTPSKGLKLQGSGGVEIFIPAHINLGVIEINGIYFFIGFSTEAPLKLGIATQIKTNLGPLKAIIDKIGTNIPMTFPANKKGNLGPLDLKFEFAAPTGIGLSVDSGVFKGGGFLFFNQEKGEYGGVLELEFQSLFTLKAIGILNTKMPDGSDGFSLFILITAEFAPIQLGFGFTLLGVGGLLGLNRTMNVEKLALGVKDGSLNYIMFPTDVVANAPSIIASIGQIFPAKNGQFVFGPMAKIGWGTPTLISVELGLIIEVADPVRIAILGVIRCILPEERLPILKLQVNFIGVLDFEKKELKFYASIFDSRLVIFTLTGDMALLIGWGDNPNFVLSIGGFHPDFTPPPMGLPPLSRLALSLLDGDNPRLRLETYFAVTSNTVQFGAKLELYASVSVASIEGWLGFDVLFQFSPFKFKVRVQAGLKAKIFDITLFSVALDFNLEGPTPWRAYGTASVSVSFFFFDVSVDIAFDVTWGDRNDEKLPPITVLPELKKALADRRNWSAALPPNAHQQISLKEHNTEGAEKEPLIVHPFGILTISQKLVPLKQDIQLVGNKEVQDAKKSFAIDQVLSEGSALTIEDVKDQFAAAQYLKLTDEQKITRKSFESMNSGVRIAGSNAFSIGAVAVRTVRYDFSYLTKKKLIRVKGKLNRLRAELFNTFLGGNAAAQSVLSHAAKQKSALAPKDIAVNQEKYVVTNTDTLTAVSSIHIYDSEIAAYSAMDTLILEKPEMKKSVQVMSAYQLEEA
jgi:hypothetical protein